MIQITLRQCGNCHAFNAAPGIICANAVDISGPDGAPRVPTAHDVCPQHSTDLEARNLEYARSAKLQASIAMLIGVGG